MKDANDDAAALHETATEFHEHFYDENDGCK